MTNVICAIAKNEDLYIKDWCEYHLHLGFDKIYIYDNSDDKEHSLNKYIDDDRVEFIPVYGIHEKNFQIKCYNEFYHSHDFDWCAFIDIDEFIVLNNWDKILNFLNDDRFANTNVIRLNWHMFGDDNLITRDTSIPVYNAFKNRLIGDAYEKHGKSIIRGNVKNLEINSCHWCKIDNKLPLQIMPDGNNTTGQVNELRDCKEAWINHYMTKTLDEYIKQKLTRGDACFEDRDLGFDYFWRLNKKTPEKIKFIDNLRR